MSGIELPVSDYNEDKAEQGLALEMEDSDETKRDENRLLDWTWI
jgi:hypothetical protein